MSSDVGDLIRQVAIYQCAPQDDDKANISKFDELTAEELENYTHARNIVHSFVGELEGKDYLVPSVKSARAHDFEEASSQRDLNALAKFSNEEESSENDDNETESSSDEDQEETEGFGDISERLCKEYISENNSRDCILLFVEYEQSNDRFGSEDRVMIVQMPFIETDTYSPGSPDDNADSLFTELQDVFDTTLKKSVLYPYQVIDETGGGDEEEVDEDQINLGEAYLYQRNGQATYWHEFLGLDEEPHKDELLLKERKVIVRAQESDDDEEPDDSFAEIESIEDLHSDDIPSEIEQFEDSGIVIELGGEITISGLSIRDVREQDPIRIGYRDGEISVEIRGHEPNFKPVGQRKYHPQNDSESNDGDELEAKDLDVFPELTEYPDLDDE